METLRVPTKYDEIKKVVLKPKVKNPSFRFDREYDEPRYFSSYSYSDYRELIKDDIVFDRREWEIAVKVGPTEKFKKVADIVGDEKATEVMEALGL